MLTHRTHYIDNRGGWQLALHQVSPARPRGRPVLMLPGYAMNAFILRHHPTGHSIAEHLAHAGFDVWCADLRGQGHAHRIDGDRRFGMADVGLQDVDAAIRGVLARTDAARDGVDVVGCSLGATYMFIHAAWWPDHRIKRMVNLGGPLRWTAVHPFVRGIARLPLPWSLLRMPGTRGLARRLLPVARRVPGLLHIYLHPDMCDLSAPGTLVQTVDDPIPRVNAEIVRWMRRGDYVYDHRNLTEDVAQLTLPLLTVVANADGIVPEASVTSAHNVMTGAPRKVVYAGDHTRPMAHADLFISEVAREQVFEPLAGWLAGAPAGD